MRMRRSGKDSVQAYLCALPLQLYRPTAVVHAQLSHDIHVTYLTVFAQLIADLEVSNFVMPRQQGVRDFSRQSSGDPNLCTSVRIGVS